MWIIIKDKITNRFFFSFPTVINPGETMVSKYSLTEVSAGQQEFDPNNLALL